MASLFHSLFGGGSPSGDTSPSSFQGQPSQGFNQAFSDMATPPDPTQNQVQPGAVDISGTQGTPQHGFLFNQLHQFMTGAQDARNFLDGDTQTMQRNQKISDAMQNMQDDPTDSIAKIAAINPQLAEQVYGSQMMAGYRNAMMGVRTAANDARATQNMASDIPRVQNLVGGLASTANADNWPQVRQAIVEQGKRAGIDYDSLLPQVFDQDAISSFSTGTINAAKQATLAQGDTRLTETARHNQANEVIGTADAAARGVQAASGQQNASNTDIKTQIDANIAQLKLLQAQQGRGGRNHGVQTGGLAMPGQAPVDSAPPGTPTSLPPLPNANNYPIGHQLRSGNHIVTRTARGWEAN